MSLQRKTLQIIEGIVALIDSYISFQVKTNDKLAKSLQTCGLYIPQISHVYSVESRLNKV